MTLITKGVFMDRSNVGIWVEMSTNIKGGFEGEGDEFLVAIAVVILKTTLL
jgi:hypothetical protein